MWLIPLLVTAIALALPAVGAAAGTGSIAGTVTAKVGGASLAGVEVCAESVSEEGLECGKTDNAGHYEIAGLAPDEYKVEFFPRGLNYVRQYYEDQATWGAATSIMVTAGSTTSDIDAELEKGATISGVVKAAATGLPVEGVEVCAFATAANGFGCGKTNGVGSYLIQGLPAGQYEVEFSAYGTGRNLLSQAYPGLVSLAAQGEATGIDASLQPGGEIGGTVRAAATGAPLAKVDVCLTEASEAWPLVCLKTPASGAYRFLGVWSGSFKVVFSPEANELEEGESWELEPDAYPTQWWNGKPTFAAATAIGVTAPATVDAIDGSLGPGPVIVPPAPVVTPPATVVVPPKPKAPPTSKPLKCRRGFIKGKAKGKVRCVKRHKPKHHRGKHHAKPSRHAGH